MAALAVAYTSEREERADGFHLDNYGYREARVTAHVRAFPNEDIYFWRKESIDNSRVVRQADPTVWAACWRFFHGATLAVVVVVALLVPHAYGILNGIRLQQLQARNVSLKEEKRRLELVESRLTSPGRLEDLALDLQLVDATPDRIHYLRGSSGEAMARLQAK